VVQVAAVRVVEDVSELPDRLEPGPQRQVAIQISETCSNAHLRRDDPDTQLRSPSAWERGPGESWRLALLAT
jgi:hypothetical protein